MLRAWQRPEMRRERGIAGVAAASESPPRVQSVQRVWPRLLGPAIASCTVWASAQPAGAVELAISGHVNRLVRFADDGKGSDVQFLDSDASNSRIRFEGDGDIGRGLRAGTLVEAGLLANTSSTVGLKEGDVNLGFFLRHSALRFTAKPGSVWLGRTSEAFDDVAAADLSNTWLVDEPFDDYTASIAWRRGDGTTVTSADGDPLLVLDVRSDFDGIRRDVLRYDSPVFGPVTLRASVSAGSTWSVRGVLAGALGDLEFDWRIGYIQERSLGRFDIDAFDGVTTSASFIHQQRFNLTVVYGRQDVDGQRSDPETFYIKGGYRWGNNAASVGWSTVQDLTEGIDSDRLTLAFVRTIPKPRVELYANFQHYPGLDGVTDVEDINSVVVGSRVKFE